MNSHYIDVNVNSIYSLTHNCMGCSGTTRCCCACYEICISAAELSKIIGYMPDAAELCPHLKSHDGFENVFEEIGSHLFRIDSGEDELCVFAYAHENRILCALHSVALKLGLSIEQVKPKACLIWPLAITDGQTKRLSMHVDAMAFRCNAENSDGSQALCPNIGLILESVFGLGFRDDLERAAHKGLQRVKIPL